ncbi:MAG TPA: hypothetical protein VEH50_10145 [Methylomirabilota bacterium]|nr:hypothetical protein [Methylomirabilota bacterium]
MDEGEFERRKWLTRQSIVPGVDAQDQSRDRPLEHHEPAQNSAFIRERLNEELEPVDLERWIQRISEKDKKAHKP